MFGIDGKREKKAAVIDGDMAKPASYELTREQSEAAEKICKVINSGKSKAFLIKGVTNSGKTEVYMKAAEEALSRKTIQTRTGTAFAVPVFLMPAPRGTGAAASRPGSRPPACGNP